MTAIIDRTRFYIGQRVTWSDAEFIADIVRPRYPSGPFTVAKVSDVVKSFGIVEHTHIADVGHTQFVTIAELVGFQYRSILGGDWTITCDGVFSGTYFKPVEEEKCLGSW